MEHMTRVPMGGAGAIQFNMNLFTDEAYQHWDLGVAMNMGLTAQKLLEQTDLTREEMEEWAVRSHTRAAKAQEEGFFDDEILPLEVAQADGKTMVVDKDQAVRANTTKEGLAGLKPAFGEGTDITAGISSPLNAGATSMILMSKETAKKKGITPLATIRSIGFAGVDPTIMGAGPVPASKKALKAAGLEAKDIDFWEINEAFCIVAQNCIKAFDIDPDKVNVRGGGVAIGHPLGATGIRLIGTLARILNQENARYGLANACVGGGQGVATIIERESD
jgi:acetyl-CoA C-acetyltransferase